jgi:hypothetical protein
MRTYLWLAGLTLGLGLAGPAHAQMFKVSVTPNIASNAPMDYRNPNVPIGGTIPRNSGFSLSQLFFSSGRSNSFSNTITGGKSTFPTPAQMQAAAPSYFAPFQMYRAPLIQP